MEQEVATAPSLVATIAPRRTVAIVGMAEASRHMAPWDRLDVPVWIMNETGGKIGAEWVKRWDRTYQMHKPFDYQRANNQNDANHWEWLKSLTKPVYMQEVDPEVPASVKFPKDEIVARYLRNYLRVGDDKAPEYFKSTAAYMLAHAGYEGYERIEIYGIEMSFETEYREQKPNFEFWIGIIGQEAEIVLPAMCGLLGGAKNVRYGYDQKPSLNPTQFGIRAMAMKKDRDQFLAEAKRLMDDKNIAEKQAKAFSGDAVRARALREKAKKLDLDVEQLLAKVNMLTGHIDEAEFVIATMGQLSQALQEWTPETPG